jgi:hypothetical protein
MIRIIARKVPWPGGPGAKLRWDALTDDGELLVPETEWPFCDAAHVIATRGADPDELVTMRHEGSRHDSFKPLPLRFPAAKGAKRAEKLAALADFRATLSVETAKSGPALVTLPGNGDGHVRRGGEALR